MKILFLIFHGFSPSNGISKKIFYQLDALKVCGTQPSLCYLTIDDSGHQKRMIEEEVLKDYGNGIKGKINKRIEYKVLSDYILNNNIKLLYIRNDHNANPFLNHFLREMKQHDVKIVMEIPTYPYDQEYLDLNLKDRMLHFFDRIFRKQMARNLHRIVTFSNHTTILGVPTINISNGIDFEHIPMRSNINHIPDQLNLIGVADIRFWHGFDRVIKGMSIYYRTPQKVKVHFHIVGSGLPEELDKLKTLTREYHLESYISFFGPKSGQELDSLFEKADMGIASLGRHRCGITNIKTLKTREYAARGIPFIYSEIDEDFEKMPYILKAPADDTPINIKQLVDFYLSHPFTPGEIRESVKSTLSWKIQMQKVIDAI